MKPWIGIGLCLLALSGFAQESRVEVEMVEYAGWPNCVRLTNGKIELIVTTDVGPRAIRLGFVGQPNLFKEYSEQLGVTGGAEWRAYGGHRLWHAPESKPRTYWPDNFPVQCSLGTATVQLRQSVEAATGIAKEIEITMDPKDTHVTVVHRLINRRLWSVELAPWAITVMAPGGRAIIPQEPFVEDAESLSPARAMALWPQVNMSDPRWTWGRKYIQVRQEVSAEPPQRVGFGNSLGWAAYVRGEDLFIKRFEFVAGGAYPNLGCNCAVLADNDALQLQSFGPLVTLSPGETVELLEHWFLYKTDIGPNEESIEQALKARIEETGRRLTQ